MTKTKNNRQSNNTNASDAIILHGTLTVDSSATASLRAFDYHMVNCNAVLGISRSHGVISDSFQVYRYRKVRVTWVPTNGPDDSDAGAIVKMQYITSPEDIVYFSQTATSANALSFMNATNNFKVFNAWQKRTFNVPLTRNARRQWYSVDTINATPTSEQLERNTQGMVAVTMEKAVNNAVILCQYKIDYEIELKGLSSFPGT